jgi:hypothetical protein
MSKWPMRNHFRYLRFKNFLMTPRTLQCEVFWAFLSNSKHSGVLEGSKSPTLGVLGFTPTLGQSGVAIVHSLTLSYTPGSMWCESRASSWPTLLQPLCLGREPKARVATAGISTSRRATIVLVFSSIPKGVHIGLTTFICVKIIGE